MAPKTIASAKRSGRIAQGSRGRASLARTKKRHQGVPFVVLTGLSGAGKSQAIRALEDLGYFCVDNLPITLIPTLAELSIRADTEMPKVALVVDVRERSLLTRFPKVLRALRTMPGLSPVLIFLEATDAALVRRFSETRRPHPLALDRPVVDGIREERELLAPIRALADETVDTSDLNVHELREIFLQFSRGRVPRGRMLVTFLSFGFKHGVPGEADLVFDVRCLPNPHFVPELRAKTGKDRLVVQFMEEHGESSAFIAKLVEFLRFSLPFYIAEGKTYLTIGIGCTGGRHRSVMIAEALRKALAEVEGVRFRVRHRDIEVGTD